MAEARWQQEREFAKRIVELRAAIAATDDSDRRQSLTYELVQLEDQLSGVQGDAPLVHTEVGDRKSVV